MHVDSHTEHLYTRVQNAQMLHAHTHMIDWLTFVIDHLHTPLPAGRVLKLTAEGEIEYDIPQRMEVEGSYDSNMWIRSQGGDGTGTATQLYLHGNPAKFLQGHNIIGSDDVNVLAANTLKQIAERTGLCLDLATAKAEKGDYSVKRIDITRSYQFNTKEEVQAAISAIAIKSRSRMGRAQTSGGTVYHGKNSRRHTMKFYAKGEELSAGKKHRLPDQLQATPLHEFAETLLRVELTLRSNELRDLNLTSGYDFTPKVVRRLYDEYFGRIEMTPQATIPSDELVALPRAIRSTYLMWKNACDVRTTMSKPTFYRHRNELLGFGIDIALPYEGEQCNVIPLFREVTGTPVANPHWAYQQGLVFDPNRVGG